MRFLQMICLGFEMPLPAILPHFMPHRGNIMTHGNTIGIILCREVELIGAVAPNFSRQNVAVASDPRQRHTQS